MKLRAILLIATTPLMSSLSPVFALAQAPYPSHPIKIIVSYAAGGLPDTVGRILARRLQVRIGQPVVVENRPGANAGIAAAALTAAAADGCTFLVSDSAFLSINPRLYARLPYDPKDVLPIAQIARAPLFLAVHQKIAVATMAEFIAYAKARPGQITYGSSGVGSVHHLSMEAISAALELKMTHVPYKGVGESVPALLGGHIDTLFAGYPALVNASENNRIKLLATNGAVRSALAPDLPAVAEFIPGFDFAPTLGLYGRAGLQSHVVEKIAEEVTAIVDETETSQQLAAIGVEALGVGAREFATILRIEAERMNSAVRTAGLTIQ